MRLGHIHLKVRNLDRAQEFYTELLGARVTERIGDDFLFLTLGDAHHDIALQALGDGALSASNRSVGLYHVAFEVPNARSLAEKIEHFELRGIGYQLVDHQISWALYSNDPDGNGIEIYLDRRSATNGAPLWHGASRQLTQGNVQAEAKLG